MDYDQNAIRQLAVDLKPEIEALARDVQEGDKCSAMKFSQGFVLSDVEVLSRIVLLHLGKITSGVSHNGGFRDSLRSASEPLEKIEARVRTFVSERGREDDLARRYTGYADDLKGFREGISHYLGEQ